MPTGQNNTANVSTTKFAKGGYCFVADPATATMPEKLSDPLGAEWMCAGYISEDGLSESLDGSSESINDANGDTVHTYGEAKTETLTAKYIEIADVPMQIIYGKGNVSTDADGNMVVEHNWATAEGDEWAIVLELLLKNGRRARKIIYKATVSEISENTLNSEEVTGREVTFTYITNENGSNVRDIYEKVDANAGAGAGGASGASTHSITDTKTSSKS